MPDRFRPYRLGLLGVALALCACGGDTDPPGASPAGAGWLMDITAEAGIDFVHGSDVGERFFLTEIVGSGGALFDYDGDGDLDVFLVNGGGRVEGRATPRSHALYRQGADGRFVDVAAEAGIAAGGQGMGATVGDYDNDGDLDLLVTHIGTDVLYRNEGDGTFADVSRKAGLTIEAWSMSAAFFDYDRDGFLDLYITTYVDWNPETVCRDSAGRVDYCGPLSFPGCPDLLYRNNGDGSFTEVAEAAGTSSSEGRGLGVVVSDFDDDGWMDVFVANDGVDNHLWMNTGRGTFEDRAMVSGVAVNSRGVAEASMGVALGDANGDLRLDLFMTHLERETNTLYTAVARKAFQDRTASAGLGVDSMPRTGFGTAFLDLENDGDLDLLIVNGRVRRAEGAKVDPNDPRVGFREPNALVLNEGAGRFAYRTELARAFCDTSEVSRALAIGDVDGDGALDVLVTSWQGPAHLYRNVAPGRGRWFAVRALDGTLRRDAIGARVYVLADERWQVRPVRHAYSYLVGGDATAHFGLGSAGRVEQIVVRWPDGAHERFPGAAADARVSVVRGRGEPAEAPSVTR